MPAEAGNWLFSGAVAAGLGCGATTVLVLVLWTTSPFPDSGLSGALQLAAELWLLAHGVELVRPDTVGGGAAIPLGVPPMLLTVLPAWLLYRAARVFADRPPFRDVAAMSWLATGYLAVASVAVAFASGGPMRPVLGSAALLLPLFAVGVTAIGVRVGPHRWSDPDPGWPRLAVAARAAVLGTGALCAGGALLVAGALVGHAEAARASFPQLTEVWSGRLAVVLLVVALVPNAAVWAAAYGLGPGFALGSGSVVTPLVVSAHPPLPGFPLLAAVPEGPGGWADPLPLVFACALPLTAAVTMAWCLARAAVPVPGGGRTDPTAWSRGDTVVAALPAAVGCGVCTALLAGFAGGPLGLGSLATFGPSWWLTGAAALAWSAALVAPVALALRAQRLRGGWRLRRRRAAEPPAGPEGWHSTETRRSRWQALKAASGGLMPDFEPCERALGAAVRPEHKG